MNNWYVYRHIRLDKNTPFYIGIGCKNNFVRAFEFKKRNSFWEKIYSKTEIKVDIILNTPFFIKSSRGNPRFVPSFSSRKAFKMVIDELTDKLWEELNESTEPKS